MSELGDVLAIRVGLSGMDTVVRGIRTMTGEFKTAAAAAMDIKASVAGAAVAIGLLFGGLKEAAEDQRMTRMLEGFTHSAEIAEKQMNAIRAISERGIFDKEELYKSLRIFDESKVALGDNLKLAEELAVRLGGEGKLEQASKIIAGLAGGGMGRLQAVLRSAGLTVEELRNAGVNIDAKYKIGGTPQQALEGIRKALSGDDALGGVETTFLARWKGMIAALKDLFRGIGAPIMAVLMPVITVVKELSIILAGVFNWFHGIIGAIVGLGAVIWIIGALASAFKVMAESEKIAAFWGTVLKVLNGGWGAIVQVVKTLVTVFKTLADREKLTAAWAAILDALEGNWINLAAGAAVAAGVGVAWYAGSGGGGEENVPQAPAERPSRRSDTERIHQRMRGRAWA